MPTCWHRVGPGPAVLPLPLYGVNDAEASVLSVVMPCFNEEDTVLESCKRVLASPYVCELVVVNDGSTDNTAERVQTLDDTRIKVITLNQNRGKGAAVRRGFAEVEGPFVVIQDADLEYDPADYGLLLGPLLDGSADVVYGSRFQSGRSHRVLYFWHSIGNKGLTLLSNALTNLNLTDMETCYKAMRREVVQALDLHEDRFGFEPEITAKVAGAGWRVYEVGISYRGRTYAEGKKIGWKDGMYTLLCIIRYSPLGRSLCRPSMTSSARSRRDKTQFRP